MQTGSEAAPKFKKMCFSDLQSIYKLKKDSDRSGQSKVVSVYAHLRRSVWSPPGFSVFSAVLRRMCEIPELPVTAEHADQTGNGSVDEVDGQERA